MKLLFLILISAVSLLGCQSSEHSQVIETHPPTPMEELKLEPNADIFQWDGAVYKTNIDWVDGISLTKKQIFGKITTQYTGEKKFKDGMATHLPIGAKVYSANERGDILLVEVDGKIIKYLILAEG